MKDIKLYWWHLKNSENAGDYFGKFIIEKLGYNCKYTVRDKQPEIVICGSILGLKEYTGNPYVWGAGFHNDDEELHGISKDKILAVRGKLTLKKLGLENIVIGDPGLLASYLYKPKTTKKYKYGIIPHYIDEQEVKQKYKGKNIPIISMQTQNIEKLLDQINECEFIFSSSLHGLIFAHSLGIPAIHVENKPLDSRDNFKFKDYYSVFKNIKYTKESLKTVNFDKYVNGDKSLYKPTKEELETIQKNLLKVFPFKHKTAICAVAKCENEYINDWVNYHLNLGFDEIYIYDNNDTDYEPVESRIQIGGGKVSVVKIPKATGFQIPTYNKFYQDHKNDFDWICFLDIDEFITLEKWSNINEFLSDPALNKYPVIRLNWRIYGDDDKVDRDISVPVYDGIKNRVVGHKWEHNGKQIVRGGIDGLEVVSNHYSLINGKLPKQIMPNGKETSGKVGDLECCDEAYIRHYMTKTLKEFINQKIARGTDASFPDRKIDFDYYWKINKKTEEKLEYIRKWEES